MASGDTLDRWSSGSMDQPAANFGTPDTRGAVDPHHLMDMNVGTNHTIIVSGVMPQNYAGTTGTTIKAHCAMSSATSGTIDIDTSFELPADLDTAIFSTPIATDGVSVPTTSGEPFVISIAHLDGTQMNSVAASNYYRIKFHLDAATAAGDLEVIAIELQET